MSILLKRDPDWLNISLVTDADYGAISLLSEDGHQVPVPRATLLTASPLLRSMVHDLHPAVHGPLVLSLTISGDVLLLVGDILAKGVANVKGFMLKEEVQRVLMMMGIEAPLDCSEIYDVVNCENIDSDRNDNIKLEILVKVERVDENAPTPRILF